MAGEVRISVVSATGQGDLVGIENLATWLRGEHELSGRVRLSRAVPAVGEMGSLTDALIVAVSAQGALTALAYSLRAWMAQPRRSDVRIRITGADGAILELDAERARTKDVESLLTVALRERATDSALEGQPPQDSAERTT